MIFCLIVFVLTAKSFGQERMTKNVYTWNGLDTVFSLCWAGNKTENAPETVALVLEMVYFVHFMHVCREMTTKFTNPCTNRPIVTLPTFPERDLMNQQKHKSTKHSYSNAGKCHKKCPFIILCAKCKSVTY